MDLAAGRPAETESAELTFSFYAFRFWFRATDALWFPPGRAGNIVRGAFGSVLRRLACVPECRDAKICPRRFECVYARFFEPRAALQGPSGLADWPRPFVFRTAHLDGRRVAPGEPFFFDVHVFDLQNPAPEYFVLAFQELAREGLGPGRGKAELTRADQLSLHRTSLREIFDGQALREIAAIRPLTLDLRPPSHPVRRVRVIFRTPTDLKAHGRSGTAPDFAVLLARLRDRLSTLRALYGPGPLPIDFRALGNRAQQVLTTRAQLAWREAMRRSTRTGRRHALGGFVGQAEYEGDLTQFLPYLQAGQWTGVGRHTVWGLGEIEATPLD